MSAGIVRGITLEQVDELIEQADKLSAICDLVLCGTPGEELRISRNNFAALLSDPIIKVREIANGTRKIDVSMRLQ